MGDTDSRTASVGGQPQAPTRAASRRGKKNGNKKGYKRQSGNSKMLKDTANLPGGCSFSNTGLDVKYDEPDTGSSHEENESTDTTSTTNSQQVGEEGQQRGQEHLQQQETVNKNGVTDINAKSQSTARIDEAATAAISSTSTPSVNWNSGPTTTIGTSLRAPNQTDSEAKKSTSFQNVNNAFWRAKSDEGASSSEEEIPKKQTKDADSDQEEGEVVDDNTNISRKSSESGEIRFETDLKPTSNPPTRPQSKEQGHYYAESDASSDDDDEPSDIILNFSGDEAQDSRLEELHNARKSSSPGFYTQNDVQVVAPLEDMSSITSESDIRRQAAIRKIRAKYPIDPTTLADLTRQDLEKQAKYLFYHLNINDIDLSLPIRCIECFENGHLSETCPNKICPHCQAWEAHDSRFCPLVRRCQHCRGRGHERENCSAPRRSCHDVPCDLCGSDLHFETECETLWRPAMRPTAVPPARIQLSISCAYCADTGHLFGDCPQNKSLGLGAGGMPWSLKGIDSSTIVNLNTVPYIGVRNGVNKIDGSAGNARNANNKGNDFRIKGKAYSGFRGGNRRDRRDDSSLSGSEENGGVFGGGGGPGRNRVRPLHQLPNRPPIRFNTDIGRGGGGNMGERGGFRGRGGKSNGGSSQRRRSRSPYRSSDSWRPSDRYR